MARSRSCERRRAERLQAPQSPASLRAKTRVRGTTSPARAPHEPIDDEPNTPRRTRDDGTTTRETLLHPSSSDRRALLSRRGSAARRGLARSGPAPSSARPEALAMTRRSAARRAETSSSRAPETRQGRHEARALAQAQERSSTGELRHDRRRSTRAARAPSSQRRARSTTRASSPTTPQDPQRSSGARPSMLGDGVAQIPTRQTEVRPWQQRFRPEVVAVMRCGQAHKIKSQPVPPPEVPTPRWEGSR